MTFVTGSVLFAVASKPHLWNVRDAADRFTIDGFVAWQFLAGVFLLFFGSVFNYWRAYLAIAHNLAA